MIFFEIFTTFDKNENSTFPPCIWLLRGFCLELYPYCLFRGHGIVFFVLTKTFQPREWSRACVCGVAPETTPEAEKSRLEQKRQSQDQGLNIGIQFQANSRSNQIWGGRFFCIPTPLVLGGGVYSEFAPKNDFIFSI